MKGLFKKAKAELEGILDSDARSSHPPAYQHQHHPRPSHPPNMSQDGPNTICDPTAIDILRYRYHHGTNLGSIYVLERWLSPSMFPNNPPSNLSSELEAVKLWVDNIGLAAARQRFEQHWANAVSDDDIKWLRETANCTTIRLPIGYWDLDPSFTVSTPFAPYASIYTSAWSSIVTLICRLRSNSIGVLLDLHALPGGANNGDHSGTNSGTARLWSHAGNRFLGVRCCQFLASQVKSGLDGVVGIQIVNESEWNAERMYAWYDDCIAAVSAIDPSIPVVISDGWNLSQAIPYALSKNTTSHSVPTCPVIIDTHYYWAFTDADRQKSPQHIIEEVGTKLAELDGKEGSVVDRGAVQTWIGEYSCVLTEESWAKAGGVAKEELVRRFGKKQSERWQSRSGGSFFWTWKMDWLPGGEWGFTCQSPLSLSPPPSLTIPTASIPSLIENALSNRDSRMYHAVNQHTSYWDHLAPNTACKHWRYENGWKVGYNDALRFFQGVGGVATGGHWVSGGNKIGNLEIWVLKRIKDSGFRGGFVWEFEQGVRRGFADFYSIVGI